MLRPRSTQLVTDIFETGYLFNKYRISKTGFSPDPFFYLIFSKTDTGTDIIS